MTNHGIDVAIIGGGPAGMATALSCLTAGLSVRIYERYSHARPAGNILNLWPPPIYALEKMGVDITDIGAPCDTKFCSSKGVLRAFSKSSSLESTAGVSFVGLLRPDLYTRMLDALPGDAMEFNKSVEEIEDRGEYVLLRFADGSEVKAGVVVGADGIDSFVRKQLWNDGPRRNHDLAIIGGYTFDGAEGAKDNECILMHDRVTQGTYSSILSKGRMGHQWWVLEAYPDKKPAPEDLRACAISRIKDFEGPLKELIEKTADANFQRWNIRDRVPLSKWSQGRITLAGDAAHATSPYAAYGAGMSICDGYFIGKKLHAIKGKMGDTEAVKKALEDYEDIRIKHTTGQVQQAYFLGRLFHYTPWPLTVVRDAILDNTPFLQWQIGETNVKDILGQMDIMGDGICS